MDLVLLGSILVLGGLLGFSGLFDAGNDSDDTADSPTDAPPQPQTPLDEALFGTAEAERFRAETGYVAGWGGDDTITALGDAEAWGNKGDDSLLIGGQASGDGGEGNDRMAVSGRGAVDGAEGDDTLIGADLAELAGGSGNDLILNGGQADAFGNAGNDEMVGNRLYGGADDDSLTGSDRLFGGKGDDVLHLTPFTGEAGSAGGAQAGEGNDSITVDDHDGSSANVVYGGSGQDTLSFFTGNTISADDATWSGDNDILIAHRSELSGEGGTVLLGKGDDFLAIDPNLNGSYDFDTATGYRLTTVRDFDPAQDKLGVIVPQDDLAQLEVTITPDIEGNFTDVIFHGLNGNPDQTWRLNGVTALTASDIALFADDQAVLDGTSYGTLDSAGQTTSGDDTLTATSGDLAGGDGNDDLTLSGGGNVSGEGGDDTISLENDYPDASVAHGGTGNDTITGSDVDEVYGDEGDDVLQSGTSSTSYGGAGNDVVRGGIDGSIFGDDGDDTLLGNGSAAQGGAGDDVLSGTSDQSGGDGNDLLNMQSYGGETDRIGDGHGGNGDDTLIAVGFASNDSGDLQGDAGDDLLQSYNNSTLDGGAGNDTLIMLHSDWTSGGSGTTGTITTGAGADHVVLDASVPTDHYDEVNVTITDFTPGTDHLSLVLPPDQAGQVHVSVQTDLSGGFTTLRLSYDAAPGQDPIADDVYRLDGVTSLEPADIALYTDLDAVTDGTSYGTLADTDPIPNEGDDTLTATSGDLAGGDGNDNLTLSGGGTASGDAGDDTIVVNNEPFEGSSIYGGTGNDTISPSFQDTIFGDDGNDVLNGGTAGESYGGQGNDQVYGGEFGLSHGDDGNDTIIGHWGNFGDAGNDSIAALQGASGGDGDDHIHVSGDPAFDTSLSGSADGGAGNDTIIADDIEDNTYNTDNPHQGGTGDDLIATFSTQSADAGAGNDILIIERAADNVFNSGITNTLSLGQGNDILALDPNADLDPYALGDTYDRVTVEDFDPSEDQLAIILPEASLANLDVSITTDTEGGFTDVTLHSLNGDPAQTFRLTGITSLDPADIALYADHAAVAARTPWQQGVTPGA